MKKALVQRGLPGKRHCTVHLAYDGYVSALPHANAPNSSRPMFVEYVRDGRCRGCAFMSEDDVMQLQLGLIRFTPKAHSFLHTMLKGATPFAGNVRDIAQLSY